MQERILSGLIIAQDMADANGKYGNAHVFNSKGSEIMRIDVVKPGYVDSMPSGGVAVFGDNSVDITKIVETALGQKFCELI